MKKKAETVKVHIHGKEIEIEKKDTIKYEIAEELGVVDKVLESGWRSLTAKETGRIGGIMAHRKNK